MPRSMAAPVSWSAGQQQADDMMCMSMEAPEIEELEVETAEVKEGLTSATFEISRPYTIPSDGARHKVTVAVVPLKPRFEYITLPKLDSRAYLKARVKNTSPYVFLPGPTNVFLDNNFVSKSSLGNVSANEDFTTSLGQDGGVKVRYLPPEKFFTKSGLVSKTRTAQHHHRIEITNTRSQLIKIRVVENLPLSNNEKIKVTVLVPELNKEKVGKDCKIDKHNNLVWDGLEIKPGETEQLELKYTVDYPANEEITFEFDV